MDGVNVSEHKLKIIANFVSTWPGRKIGRLDLISVANETGTKPPLVWVFNAAHEFPALAAALGEDQPLIGLRSLNTAVHIDKLIAWDERLLARHYAADLLPAQGNRECFVGGNCQGAPIAAALARELVLSGGNVRGFIAMEWADLPPLPLRSSLLFGAASEQHNPYLRNLDPWPMWRRLYPEVSCDILPGRHGTYFNPGSIPVLADAIRNSLSLPPASLPLQRPAVDVGDLPTTVQAGERIFTRLTSPSDIRPGDDMVLLWDSHFSCLPHRETASLTRCTDGTWQLEFSVPTTPGVWTLQMYLCHEGCGPQSWANDTTRYYQVTIEEGPIPRSTASQTV